jgi:hypothetical protein
VASDIAVHREVCGGAALYFDRFSPQELAARVETAFATAKKRPAPQPVAFSWRKHVDGLLQIAGALMQKPLAAAA